MYAPKTQSQAAKQQDENQKGIHKTLKAKITEAANTHASHTTDLCRSIYLCNIKAHNFIASSPQLSLKRCFATFWCFTAFISGLVMLSLASFLFYTLSIDGCFVIRLSMPPASVFGFMHSTRALETAPSAAQPCNATNLLHITCYRQVWWLHLPNSGARVAQLNLFSRILSFLLC